MRRQCTHADAILLNQHRNGAWSQVLMGPTFVMMIQSQPAFRDWPREHPGGDYWWHYTFNDGAMAVIETLLDAERLYGETKYKQAAIRCGEFILLAQMPARSAAGAAIQHRHASGLGTKV